MTRESDSRHDPEIARRLEAFGQQQPWRPEPPRTPLPIVIERSLAGIDALKEELIATGIDPSQKHSNPVEGALFNHSLVENRISPIVDEFFERTNERVGWVSTRRWVFGPPGGSAPLVNYNMVGTRRLTYGLIEGFRNLTPELIQALIEVRNEREMKIFGNTDPNHIIGKFIGSLKYYQIKK